MCVMVGGARINELGKVAGGAKGDQNKKEVCLHKWYNGKWDKVIRPINPEVGKNMALVMQAICANDNIGYDQPDRNSAYRMWLKYGRVLDIKEKCSTDCTASVTLATIAGFKATGLSLPLEYGTNAPTSRNLEKVLRDTGRFMIYDNKEFTKSEDYLKPGDILLRTGHHAVMCIDRGNKADMTSVIQAFNPYSKPILTVKKGSKGNGVRWVQWQLNKRFGYNVDIDGSFGDQTDEVVRAFQRQFGLEDDGRVGPKTKEVLNSK